MKASRQASSLSLSTDDVDVDVVVAANDIHKINNDDNDDGKAAFRQDKARQDTADSLLSASELSGTAATPTAAAAAASSAAAASRAAASSTTPVRWWPTFTALLRKNVLLQMTASRWQLLIVFLLPCVAVALTYTMQRVSQGFIDNDNSSNSNSNNNNNQDAALHILVSPSTQAIRPCTWYDVYQIEATQECATILYAPYTASDTSLVNKIMQYMAQEANLPFVPIPDSDKTDQEEEDYSSVSSYLDSKTWSGGTVVGVPSVQDIGKFLVAHPGRAQAIVYFANPLLTTTTTTTNNNTTTTTTATSMINTPLVYFRYNETRNEYYYDYNYNGQGTTELQSNAQLIPMALQRAVMANSNSSTTRQINIRIAKRNMFGNINVNDDNDDDDDDDDDDENNNNNNQPQEQEETTASSLSEQEQQELQQQEQQREADKKQVANEVVSYLLGPILVFSLCMSASMLANQVAAEKSQGLIGSLRVVGMADSAYWASWWLVQTVCVVLPASLLIVALCYAMDIVLVTEVNAVVLILTIAVQYTCILALHYAAVAIATNRPFLYALYFCLLCLCVTSVSLAPPFRGGPGDKVGKAFGYAVPGYQLGGVLDSMDRYNARAGYSVEAQANFSTYAWPQFWQSFGQCNQTALDLSFQQGTPLVCQEIEIFDEATCWEYRDCRGYETDNSYWNDDYCAPDSCYFYPMADVTRTLVMVGQTLVWMVLAWYFLQVLPSGNGLTYPPWFPFLPKYWSSGRFNCVKSTSSSDQNNMSREQRKSKRKKSMILRGLTKTFNGTTTAVDNVDMDIKNGQVFVLLGHNGAGKSTLVNMLTGKLSPTSGDAYIMGLSIKDNVHGIQRLVSCVPQHDLLWSDLSATEHIRMFAQIKGVSRRNLQHEVDKVLRRVHLTDAAKQSAGGYSGGMKRRLSIALAGIGGPKIIMLDEPTTGIDPLNRRRIWNLVRELKQDRIVVLTTHLMQEADCLGDQIAVLDNGKIQAQGTPLNLKTEYGSGYSLSIVTDVANVDRVKSLTQELMPNAELVNEAAGSLAFGVHADEIAAIPDLIRQLQSEGLIREWNISQSTIEEVFLRLASQSTSMQSRQQQMQNTLPGSSSQGGEAADRETESETIPADIDLESGHASSESDVFAGPSSVSRLQLGALLRKAFILRRRHWIATLVQLAIPIALVAIAKKFFFKDISLDPQEVLVWPQAKIMNYGFGGVFDESQCTFDWKLWSKSESGRASPIETLTNAEGAAASIEFPDSFINRQANRLSFQVSGVTGLSTQEVQEALIEAMRHYLTRTTSESTQDEADAYCQDFSCGPCLVDLYRFETKEIDTDRFECVIEASGGSTSRCQSTYSPCGLDQYRIMLADPDTAERASQTLNKSPITIENLASRAQISISLSSMFRSPVLEVNTGATRPGNGDFRRCESCPESLPHLWLSGPSAVVFESSLALVGPDFTSRVVTSGILDTVGRNRQSLSGNATHFNEEGLNDTSSCSRIGRPDYDEDFWYAPTNGILGNDQGYIVNFGNIQPWPENTGETDFLYDLPGIGPVCNATLEPLSLYRELFPDAGITLTSFEVAKESIVLDVVWEIDMDNFHYLNNDGSEKSFGPSQQSVYAVYCPNEETDEQGQCISESELICVRAVPYSGCDGYSYYVSNSDLIEATYAALWEATGAEGGIPVVERISEEANVSYEAAVNLDELALFVFMITVAVALHAPNTSSVLVFEKNQRFIFAMLLNGLKLHIYWFAQYLSHLITTGVLAAVTILLGVALQLKPFTTQNPSPLLLLVVLFSGIHAQFGLIVLLSSLFKKERFAAVLVGFMALTLLGGAILTHLASQPSLHSGWPPALSLIPMFGFFRSLLLVFWKRYYAELWAHIGVMLGSSTLYLALGIYRQTSTGVGALFKWDCGLFSHIFGLHGRDPPATTYDEDVDDLAEADIAKEEHRALNLTPSDTAIKITHLGKTFPARPNPKNAVVDVTMAMDYGEIFGLLGPNGAGKTTVISMLVGQLTPTRGSAHVAGYDTVEERRSALSKLGIVPQFDVYYPELTVREHLMLYAAMKGVKQTQQSSWAQSIAATVGLGGEDLFNRQASALSGGMRRRLSIAVALLSKPTILFLDEPTTGLDVEMKRSIWNIIERMRHNRCVILTTHAMDEAEALCTRIGIMSQGSLKCIGSQKELRERYGSTYELTFTVPKGTAKADLSLEKYLSNHCPSTTLISNFGETRVFTVDKSDLELADLFEVIIKARGEKLYTEYGINNTSLDEVFIAITAESEGVETGEL